MNKLASLFCLFIQLPMHALVWNMPPSHFTPLGSSQSEDLASDPAGNAITIWADLGDGTVKASYFSAVTESYGPEQIVSSGAASEEVQVAMDASGTALAIWYNYIVGDIRTSVFNGTTWTAPALDPLQSGLDGFFAYPSIAMNGIGLGASVWIDTTDVPLTLSSFFSAGNWSAPITIGTGTEDTSVAYRNSNAVASWTNGGVVTAAFYNGSWQVATPLGSVIADIPSIAGIDDAGNAIVVWLDNATADVMYSLYNGSWSSAQSLSTASGNLQVAFDMAPNGTAIAIWADAASNGQYSVFNGTAWSSPLPFATGIYTDGYSSNQMSVAVDSSGNAIAIWASNAHTILSASLPLGGTFTSPSLVSQVITDFPPPQGVYAIQAALSDNGRAFTSWDELYNFENFQVFGTFSLFPPPPPEGIDGRACVNRLASQSDLVHIIEWSPSPDPEVTAYYLRRNGIMIAIIPATGPFIYYDHNRHHNKTDEYTVTAVGPGGESAPVTIIIK